MPARLWFFSAVMLVALVAGYFLRRHAASPDDAATAPANGEAATAASAAGGATPAATAGNAAGPTTPAEGPAPFPGSVITEAVIGEDGVARMEAPFQVPPGPEPDAAFQAEIDAWAGLLREQLPLVDGLTTLDTVEVDGRVIVLNHRIGIDLRAYTLPQDKPELLIPGLDGWLCDGNTCFEIKPEFAEIACRSSIRPLLDGGAAGVYKYRDANGLPIAVTVVSGADCAA
ncbi:MAG: hypothetical protein IT337_14485 [Thermomicrobiales bacterium]|nr:hypothetical protein [Thermomicrobiales bacterium]